MLHAEFLSSMSTLVLDSVFGRQSPFCLDTLPTPLSLISHDSSLDPGWFCLLGSFSRSSSLAARLSFVLPVSTDLTSQVMLIVLNLITLIGFLVRLLGLWHQGSFLFIYMSVQSTVSAVH